MSGRGITTRALVGYVVGGTIALAIIVAVFTALVIRMRRDKKRKSNDAELAQAAQREIGDNLNIAGSSQNGSQSENDQGLSLFALVASISALQNAESDASALQSRLLENISKTEQMITQLDTLLGSAPAAGYHPDHANSQAIVALQTSICNLIGTHQSTVMSASGTSTQGGTNLDRAPGDTSASYARLLGIAGLFSLLSTATSKSSTRSYDVTLRELCTSLAELRQTVSAATHATSTGEPTVGKEDDEDDWALPIGRYTGYLSPRSGRRDAERTPQRDSP